MTSIFVGNISWKATDTDLKQLFESYGTVNSARIISDRDTGKSRGFGFVEMNDSDAKEAITKLNGADLLGRPLVVNQAKPRA